MTIRVHALEDSSHLRPYGDCYAPQVVLTGDSPRPRWGIHTLNDRYLPASDEHIAHVWAEFLSRWPERHLPGYPKAEEAMKRYFRIFYDTEVHYKVTRGFSQGDWGHSFVFATPEWLEMTGAPGVRESDHNDFCAWLWGDVYEVFQDGCEPDLEVDVPWLGDIEEGDDSPLIVYGMDEAMKYGDITYPTHHSYVSYDYD